MTLADGYRAIQEQAAIGAVVRDFRRALPAATVYVYDNRSSDRTVEIARAAFQPARASADN